MQPVDGLDEADDTPKTLIVKRQNFLQDDQWCQILNINDITSYIKLQKEQYSNGLLKALNASVNHEMLQPLKV